MSRHHRLLTAVLWMLQWALASTFFVAGLLKLGLTAEALQQQLHLVAASRPTWLQATGLVELLAGMLIVIPSATGFFPRLSPVMAAGLGAAALAGIVAPALPAGLGVPAVDLALAAGCLTVVVGRGFVLRVEPLRLGPDPVETPPPVDDGPRHLPTPPLLGSDRFGHQARGDSPGLPSAV